VNPWPWTGLGCDLCGFGSVENVDEFNPTKPCPECGTVATPVAAGPNACKAGAWGGPGCNLRDAWDRLRTEIATRVPNHLKSTQFYEALNDVEGGVRAAERAARSSSVAHPDTPCDRENGSACEWCQRTVFVAGDRPAIVARLREMANAHDPQDDRARLLQGVATIIEIEGPASGPVPRRTACEISAVDLDECTVRLRFDDLDVNTMREWAKRLGDVVDLDLPFTRPAPGDAPKGGT
jgi:hypothetical protein